MVKPEEGRDCRVLALAVGLVLAVAAVVALLVCVMCLDARRRNQVEELAGQLDTLRLLVDSIQEQLDRHEERINATLQNKSSVSAEPTEEEDYEQYEYDDDASYEYEDEDEIKTKGTVKRTTILSANNESSNSTDGSEQSGTRTRRDVRHRDVAVREESLKPESSRGREELGPEVKSPHHRTEQYQLHSAEHQEQKRPDESVRLRHKGRHRSASLSGVEIVPQGNSAEELIHPLTSASHILAAHFVGDASSYNTRDHSHYYGNNILHHPDGLFKDWVPSHWMFELGTYQDFPIHSGKLNIQKPGIYFVYAQVYYSSTHDRCGFHIKHNGEEVAQCTAMTTGRILKRNTCFTAVVLHLHKSDLIWVSEVEGFRNTSFRSSHSFFGLIRLKPT